VEHMKCIDFRGIIFFLFFNHMKLSGGRGLLKFTWSGLLPLKRLSVWSSQSLVTVEKCDMLQLCQLLEYEEEYKRD